MELENLSQSTDVNPFKVTWVKSAARDDAQLSQLDKTIHPNSRVQLSPKNGNMFQKIFSDHSASLLFSRAKNPSIEQGHFFPFNNSDTSNNTSII